MSVYTKFILYLSLDLSLDLVTFLAFQRSEPTGSHHRGRGQGVQGRTEGHEDLRPQVHASLGAILVMQVGDEVILKDPKSL